MQVFRSLYMPLNFQEVRQLFLEMEDLTLICAVLQALKWRITKTRKAYTRRLVVISYVAFDLVGCKEDQMRLQEALLLKEQRVQEFSLRLINAMASDFYGRSYFVQSSQLIMILISILHNEVRLLLFFYLPDRGLGHPAPRTRRAAEALAAAQPLADHDPEQPHQLDRQDAEPGEGDAQ